MSRLQSFKAVSTFLASQPAVNPNRAKLRSRLQTACALLLLCGATAIASSAQTFATLFSFESTGGTTPMTGLVQGVNGRLYGTTSAGGTYSDGTVFQITSSGKLATLHSFDGADGQIPSALVLVTDGNFYGTTQFEAANGHGTVFKIAPAGTLTTIYSFCAQSNCTDGANPIAGLVQANGKFYGTTSTGGTFNDGTIFEITSAGKLTTLHSFDGADGQIPSALIEGTDGNFYGATQYEAAHGFGTAFQITPSGTLTTLYSFCSQTNCADGGNPVAGLVQATSGTFYGTAPNGGANSDGVVYSLTTGLSPFVESLPTTGKVGVTVIILGTNLTGSTSVSFNGTAAAFTVASATAIKAIVPTGATTGPLTVTTPTGKLTSNLAFRIT